MLTKKSLGQHFLKSQKAVRSMVVASDIKIGDIVLEIGPGMGVLTELCVNTVCLSGVVAHQHVVRDTGL